jgi:hypothetical protein
MEKMLCTTEDVRMMTWKEGGSTAIVTAQGSAGTATMSELTTLSWLLLVSLRDEMTIIIATTTIMETVMAEEASKNEA